ncbi:thioredoxin family protein [Candidatus Woesearchaeota archaeon]|nr:thioredoxin family protein [Candidatus Woesearchaeota archaeon]
MIGVTADSFNEEVLQSDKAVLAVFSSDQSSKCDNALSILENLSEEFSGIRFVKIDIIENQEFASRLGIGIVPSFVLFKDGKAIGGFSGSDLGQIKAKTEELAAKINFVTL